MARKKKVHIEKYPGIPRGCENIASDLVEIQPGRELHTKDLRLDHLGREISDPTPLALPLRKTSVFTPEQLRHARALMEEANGPLEPESFEEANDFELDDDFGEFVSLWEKTPDDERAIEEYRAFKETGAIPEHMIRTLERQKARREWRDKHNPLAQKREKPSSGKPEEGAPPAEGKPAA